MKKMRTLPMTYFFNFNFFDFFQYRVYCNERSSGTNFGTFWWRANFKVREIHQLKQKRCNFKKRDINFQNVGKTQLF